MAARSVSPGGALLRTSRMFSLPAPIPPPPGDGLAVNRSKTATTVFPTHQIISTPGSSRVRGDWGLKRPLPISKTTGTTYAMLRVKELDSIEGITDYSSSTDLGITLRKFHELHLPVTVPKLNLSGADMLFPQPSAFEETNDFTAVDPEERTAARNIRWKFTGPWLAGMSQGEFVQWLEKTVRPKRPEFRNFLKQRLAADINRSRAEKALDQGQEAPPSVDPLTVSEEELVNYLRKLRGNRETLFDMVGEFLDLAPLRAPSIAERKGSFWSVAPPLRDNPHTTKTESPYAENGPPVTHPSAGLSYLRTASYLDNHPFYGPQKTHPPVEARVVRPRRRMLGLEVKLGVAGFITERPGGNSLTNRKDTAAGRLDRMDLTTPGGAKMPVQAMNARINSRGRVEITVLDADTEAVLVTRELLGDDETTTFRKPPEEEPAKFRPRPNLRARDLRNQYNNPKMSSARDYGLTSNMDQASSKLASLL